MRCRERGKYPLSLHPIPIPQPTNTPSCLHRELDTPTLQPPEFLRFFLRFFLRSLRVSGFLVLFLFLIFICPRASFPRSNCRSSESYSAPARNFPPSLRD